MRFSQWKARIAGRSYWKLRYVDGRTISEPEVDWSLAPAKGRACLQLVCPDGRVAELGNSRDASGRLFQFKCATVSAGVGRHTDAQVIGLVEDGDGNCRCAAWEYTSHKLVTFRDNVHAMRYQNVGALNPDVLGLKD